MTNQCKLLEGMFSYCIQALLGLLALFFLLIKRYRENPKRSWTIWLMDVSKQCASGLCIHYIAILMSLLMASLTAPENECAWYFLVFVMDTVLGTFISYILLISTSFISNKYNIRSLLKSGDYGIPPSKCIWIKQLIVWCIIVIISRLVTGFVIWCLHIPFGLFVNYIATIFINRPHLFLILIMIICPFMLNLIQIWIQDNFLKKKIVIHPIIEDVDSIDIPTSSSTIHINNNVLN